MAHKSVVAEAQAAAREGVQLIANWDKAKAADPKNIDTLRVRGRVREAMRIKAGN